MRSQVWLTCLFFAFFLASAQAAPLSGTKTVGSGGDYATVGGAISSIQAEGLSGPLVLELMSSYLGTTETYPLVFTNLGTSATNTVTLRPAADATALTLSSATTSAATVDLNGAKYLTIDGRPGGAGTVSQLSIANTSTSGVALRFINDATNNTVTFASLSGANTSATSGVVVFSTTTGTTGNDNNILNRCDIRDGAGTPANGVYSLGTTTSTTLYNSSNSILDCNIFNFYSSSVDSAGVRIDGGNTQWTINGSSFYQTATRTAVAGFVRPIFLNTTAGNLFGVRNNFIGGSAPEAGGTPWTTTGTTAAYRFTGIHLNVNAALASSVQGNTVRNMEWTSSSNVSIQPGVWSGVYFQNGAANVGTTTGNTIGSGSGTGSVRVTSSGSGTAVYGITSAGTGAMAIAGNTVGSLTTHGTDTTVSVSLIGIQVTAGTNTISGNIVGSTQTADSLSAATASTSATSQHVTGIISLGSTSASITGNTVASLANSYEGTAAVGQVRGIVASLGAITVTGNVVRDLSTASRNTSTAANSAAIGIVQASSTGGQTMSQNVVHSLESTATAAGVSVTGIHFSGPSSGTNVAARNLVHSLAVPAGNSSATVHGMSFGSGIFTAQNNMVHVGIDAAGNSTAGSATVRGIYDDGATSGRNFYHNSVHVGGVQTSGTSSTCAFGSTGVSNTRVCRNNIFANARGNAGATGRHYAVSYGGTTVNPTGLTAGSNLFFASGTGGATGTYNGSDCPSLAAWQAATGQDASSAVADPMFVNTTGGVGGVDLHLQASNPAEGCGLDVPSVADDFDGALRGGLTPVDIGADAGNFSRSADVFAPAIVCAPLTSREADDLTLASFATVTDAGGVAVGASAPRLYYKKAADADVFGGNTAADNGWKQVAASNGTSPFSFTIDPAIINGGTVNPGDVIQYFVVAQDLVGNLASSPPGASATASPAVQNVSTHGSVSSFVIILPITGTRTIGPGASYASISAALTDLQINGLGGPVVLELLPTYVSTVETFPLVFSNVGTSAAKPLTLRPQAGASGLSFSSANSGPAVDLNGAQYVTIDGRPGGVGTTSQLTITNTNTAGVALRFINEASDNAVRHVSIRGVNSSQNSGVVVFGSTTGQAGNDNNTIDRCDIREGATLPANCLYALGNTTTTAQNNSGNTISNCNICNFQGAVLLNAAGIRLDGGNTEWTITGNSFYQTATRVSAAASTNKAIFLNSPSGNGFYVANNAIGGDSPNAAVSAQKWTTTGTAADYVFVGIHLNVGAASPSGVHGNVIRNFAWSAGSSDANRPGVWSGVYVQAGAADIGSVAGNTIGSGTGTGSISVTSDSGGSVGAAGTFGIGSISSADLIVANNTIGSITTLGLNTNAGSSITGINLSNGTPATAITNNTVGSLSTANSLHASYAVGGSAPQKVIGILCTTGTTTGNTVANLTNAAVSTAALTQGIILAGGLNAITGNTVCNLTSAAANTDLTSNQALYGILNISTSAGQNISQNVVHSLSNTTPTGRVGVTGIYSAGPTSGFNTISRNFVHSLSLASSAADSVITGIQVAPGIFIVKNNMVRVGIGAGGASTAGASTVCGISDNGTTSGRSYYHNSVHVGGTQTSGAANTYAFYSDGITNVRAMQSNIFVNARGNSTGTGRHYAVAYGGTTVNPAGLTSNGNIFFTSGTGGMLGRYNSADRATLAAWRIATGQDVASAVVNPLFVNAEGGASTVDLHLQTSNPAESGVFLLAEVADDFDGQPRTGGAATDVGADAGNFNLSGDVFAPVIRCPVLTGGTPLNRVLTGFATVVDPGGVAGGTNAPRLYYKKSTDADVFGVLNTAAGNGWKYVTASNTTSPFSFTIDYARIRNGSVSAGDVIQYFIVAQDETGNLGSSPAGAGASASPPVPNVNSHGNVQSYSILGAALSGTKTVGAGGNYTSLSGAGGLFAALNAAVVTDHVVINITGDLTEDGSVVLNDLNLNDPASAFTVTVKPATATMKTISGSSTSSLITLNGADRVTIDGRYAGGGRYLTFRNTSSGGMTIQMINDCTGNVLRNCVVEGAKQSSFQGVIYLGGGVQTGNHNNLITENQVRNHALLSLEPTSLIATQSSVSVTAATSNTISNNELFNFGTRGVFIDSGPLESWTISGNDIRQAEVQSGLLTGISVVGSGVAVITGNHLHDLLTTTPQSYGIAAGGTGTTTISGNLVTCLSADAGMKDVRGILVQGSAGSRIDVINNQVSLAPAGVANIDLAGLAGLYDDGVAGCVVNIYHNTFFIGGTGNGSSWASHRAGSSTHTAVNNIFFNNRTGVHGNFAAGTEEPGGSYVADHNLYAGTGSTPASFMAYSVNFTVTPVSYATWLTSTGGDAASSGGTVGGAFSSAMFANAAVGDLYLATGGSPLVNDAGVPVAGIATDHGGGTRSPNAPEIGSDELSSNALLTSMALSAGPLSPAFDSQTTSYAGPLVSYLVTNTTVSATRADSRSVMTANLQALGTPVGLSPGMNVISVLVTAQDGVSTKTYMATVTRRTGFEEWALVNNVTSDPHALGANGQSNLLNFAFNMGPSAHGALRYTGSLAGGGSISGTGQPVVQADGAGPQALFIRRKDHVDAGLSYQLQFSSNLVSWVDAAAVPVIIADDGTNQVLCVPFPALVDNQKGLFFRVRVLASP